MLGGGPGRGHQPVVHTRLQPESRGDRVQRSADVSETPARGTLQASPRSHIRLLGPQRRDLLPLWKLREGQSRRGLAAPNSVAVTQSHGFASRPRRRTSAPPRASLSLQDALGEGAPRG